MGVKGSSSKKKSSKKKRNKISSQVLKKKSRRKELRRRVNSEYASSSSESDYRNRKVKSKKLNPVYSVSSTSDDGSVSPNSDSSSTYDSYRRRKAQHRSRIASKSRKKGSLKRLSGHVDDAGSRKRKRSRLNKEHVVKSRKKVQKKSRKHLNESSSSDSQISPQCLGGSSSRSSDGEHQRGRVPLDKEIKRSKHREIHRDCNPHRIQSPSSSPCSRGVNHVISVDHSTAALTVVNNSRRLKSVIYVVNQDYDDSENRFEMDPNKEEIVCDHNDYPSPKSLDSNDGSKKVSESASDDNKFNAEHFEDREVSGIIECDYDRYRAGDSPMDEDPSNNFDVEREPPASVTVFSLDEDINRNSFGNDDLEAILRVKALENLKKFRGGLQAGITKHENDDEPSAQRVDSIQAKSTKQDCIGEKEMAKLSKPALKRNFSQVMGAAKESNGEQVDKGYGISKQDTAHFPADASFLDDKEKNRFASDPAVFTKFVSTSNTKEGTGSAFSCKTSTEQIPSSVHPILVETSLKEQQHEANDGSEFEQKTMSVMRGGELVRVSYKVYIPKRTPALARRQLWRQ